MTTKQQRKPPARRVVLNILKGLYFLLFAVCALILVLYIVFKVTVRPPEVDETPEVVITVQPSRPAVTAPVEDEEPVITDEPEPEVTTIQLVRKEQFHTFLLLGTDDGNGNADTIMIGAYDLKNNKVSAISVPRDTLVDVSRRVKKINGAYGIGGVEELLNELEPILGFRPDHYIKVDLYAFVRIVDILGGVSFYVPEDMFHNDGAGFVIDLKEGTQWLNGEQAMQLVRYRGYQNADLGRMQTQQKFIKELAKQVLSWSTVTKINEFASVFSKYLDTDLSVTELAYFGVAALKLDFSGDVTFGTLPGRGDASYQGINWYYELDEQATLDLINATVNPYTTDITTDLTDIFRVS